MKNKYTRATLFLILLTIFIPLSILKAEDTPDKFYGNINTLVRVKKAYVLGNEKHPIIHDHHPARREDQSIIITDPECISAVNDAWVNRTKHNGVMILQSPGSVSIGKVDGEANVYYTAIQRNKPTHLRLNLDPNSLNTLQGPVIDNNGLFTCDNTGHFVMEDVQCIDASGEYLYLGSDQDLGLLNNPYYHQLGPIDGRDYSEKQNKLLQRGKIIDSIDRCTILGITSVFNYNKRLKRDKNKMFDLVKQFEEKDDIGKNFKRRFGSSIVGNSVNLNKGWLAYCVPRYVEIKDPNDSNRIISRFLFVSFFREENVDYFKTYLVEEYPSDFAISVDGKDQTDTKYEYDIPSPSLAGKTKRPITITFKGDDKFNYGELQSIECVRFKSSTIKASDPIPPDPDFISMGNGKEKTFTFEATGSKTGECYAFGMILHFSGGRTFPYNPSPKTVGDKYLFHWTTLKENVTGSTVPSKFTLDYDILSQDFEEDLPPVTVEIKQPDNFAYWDGYATISYTPVVDDPGNITEETWKVNKMPEPVYDTVVRINPTLSWTTRRNTLGDDPTVKKYHANGITQPKSFSIYYEGTVSRPYHYLIYGPRGQVSISADTRVAQEPFRSDTKTFSLQAKVHNGIKIPLYPIPSGQTHTGKALLKKLYWEGDRYSIPVNRFMRNVDKKLKTKGSIVRADGQYDRIFRHEDKADITYEVTTTFKDWFKSDRGKARDNEGNYKNLEFEKAPFATDTSLQKYAFPIKSGYFYKPYGQYKVTLKTVIYKQGNDKTEHKAMVQKLKDSFWIDSELPTVDEDKNITVDRNGTPQMYDDYGYPVKIEDKYKVAKTKLTYAASPGSLDNYFKTDDSIMGIEDHWLPKMLEGWKASNTLSSWIDKQYREYVKQADLYKYEETTVITITINPEETTFFIIPDTNDGQYHLRAGFGAFDNARTNNKVTCAGCGEIDDILFTIIGSMYDDSANY